MPCPIRSAAASVFDCGARDLAEVRGEPEVVVDAEPEGGGRVGEVVAAELAGLGDEGGVAGVRHRGAQRDLADAAARVVVVVLELLAVDDDRAGARHDRVRRQPGPQQRQAADGLERRARRRLPVGRHVVAVGARTVRGGEDRAGRRPDRDQRAGRADTRERPLGCGLQPLVHGQLEGGARQRVDAEQLALVAVGGHRVDDGAVDALQLVVVPRLQSGEPGLVADLRSCPGPPRSSPRSRHRRCRGSAPRTPWSARAGRRPGSRSHRRCRRTHARRRAARRSGGRRSPRRTPASPAASTCFTYGAASSPTRSASRRADSPARAAGTLVRSMPNRTTGRSVTSAKPSEPTIGPRAPPIGVTSRTVDLLQAGLDERRATRWSARRRRPSVSSTSVV